VDAGAVLVDVTFVFIGGDKGWVELWFVFIGAEV
jgi:hypothetical protein